jgi:hypothetical protein
VDICVKTCTCCKVEKPLVEFGKSSKATGTGYKAVCKICLADKLRKARLANPEKARERDRIWASKNKEKISIKNKRRNANLTLDQKLISLVKTAEKRGTFKCFITVEHLHDVWQRQKGLCAYTKLPLSSEAHQLNTVSLDRIDSDKDYTADNIQLVCVPINRMKLDYTESQFIQLCELVAQNVSKQTT